MSMQAKLVEEFGDDVVIDQYDQVWDVVMDDMAGRYAVEREESDHWACGIYSDGHLHEVEEGHGFDGSNPSELIASRVHGWMETVGDEEGDDDESDSYDCGIYSEGDFFDVEDEEDCS